MRDEVLKVKQAKQQLPIMLEALARLSQEHQELKKALGEV